MDAAFYNVGGVATILTNLRDLNKLKPDTYPDWLHPSTAPTAPESSDEDDPDQEDDEYFFYGAPRDLKNGFRAIVFKAILDDEYTPGRHHHPGGG